MRVVIAALVAVVLGLTATAAAAAPLPGAPACPVLPADNVWNRRVDALPVLPGSDALVRSIGIGSALHPDFSDAGRYGIPVNIVSSRTPRSRVRFDYASESDRVRYPIPARPRIEGGGDRHVLMLDRDACRLYELFAAERTGSGWSAGSGAVKRSAWSMTPARTSSHRARPGRIGSPAASALVHPGGRSRLERRSNTAPDPALQPEPVRSAANSS